ncbi:MAG: penicillin acylase family protein [Pseudomonadota bacterium]
MRQMVFGGMVIAALGAAAFLLLGAGSAPSFDREAALARAALYDARIVRDAYGVPHIFGDRDVDVAFGFAYAQAEDNIRNIEESFRFARAEMGAKTGRKGARTDYLVAAMRVQETFEEKYETDLSPEIRAALDAYADGINYYCAEKKGRCSKDFAPLVGREVAAAPKTRGPFVYGLDRVLAGLFREGVNAGQGGSDFQRTADLDPLTSGYNEAYASYVGVDTGIIGSNAIAVAPSRSDDGHTRLYSNAHQPFVGPTALYEARIQSGEGWDIYGAFVAGSPFSIFGVNENLGWTITVSKPDLIDVYELEVDDPDDPKRYRMDGEWLDLSISTTTLKVKLWGPITIPVKRKVYQSVHGPVLETPSGWFAISFAGYGDIRSLEQLYGMNKAKTKEEWLDAMAVQGVAAFNVVYADKEGNIGYYYNSRSPVRSPDWDWSRIAPGNRSDLLWQGIHPFGTVNPVVENPASGFVVSANHDPFHSTGSGDNPKARDFPAHVGVVSETSNRGLRIFELFDEDPEITRDELLAYKMDGVYAEESYLMILLRDLAANPAIAGDAEFAEALELFSRWDGNTEIESREAALATRVGHLLLGIQLNPTKADPKMSNPVAALRRAIAELEEGFGRIDPTWGEVNRLTRGGVDLPLRGGPDVLRAIYSLDNPKDGPLSAVAGDSLQYYVDWDLDGHMRIDSVYHYGANKADHASPHYTDQMELFASEEFRQPPMSLEAALKEATSDRRIGSR